MKKLYKVDAVHPIAKRVVKSNLTEDEMLNLYNELLEAGYEDENIKRDIIKVIYQDGDVIEIPPETFDVLPDSVHELEVYTQKDVELSNVKQTMKYIWGKNPKVMKGKVIAERVNRSMVVIVIDWENPNDGWERTNTSWVEALGFEFEIPECEVFPIVQCHDNLLNEDEMIIKRLMIKNNWTQEKAIEYLEPVYEAMKDAEIVFYLP